MTDMMPSIEPPILTGIPIVIDGTNFINRILSLVTHDLVAAQFWLTGLRSSLRTWIQNSLVFDEAIEFVCSERRIGPKRNQLTETEQRQLFERFMREDGVHVDIIRVGGQSRDEKGVDAAVQQHLTEFARRHRNVALVSSDRDYIPVLRELRRQGKRIYLVDIDATVPVALANEAWSVIDIRESWHWLFQSATWQGRADGLTIKDVKLMISWTDPASWVYVAIRSDGTLFVRDKFGPDDKSIRFRIERRGPKELGPVAASNQTYVETLHKAILEGWSKAQSAEKSEASNSLPAAPPTEPGVGSDG
jgi:uncharacterized LabA/DUF88 family protein